MKTVTQDDKPVGKLQSFFGIESERESPFLKRRHDITVLSPLEEVGGINFSPLSEESGIDLSLPKEEIERLAIFKTEEAEAILAYEHRESATSTGFDGLDGPEKDNSNTKKMDRTRITNLYCRERRIGVVVKPSLRKTTWPVGEKTSEKNSDSAHILAAPTEEKRRFKPGTMADPQKNSLMIRTRGENGGSGNSGERRDSDGARSIQWDIITTGYGGFDKVELFWLVN